MSTNEQQDHFPEVVFKDLSFHVMAAVFDVHNTLGHGFLENVYEKALAVELSLRGISFEAQKPLKVFYKGEDVGTYVSDIIVNDQIIIELKSVEKLMPVHEAQLLNYLKATGKKLGLLINFGKERVEHKRFVL